MTERASALLRFIHRNVYACATSQHRTRTGVLTRALLSVLAVGTLVGLLGYGSVSTLGVVCCVAALLPTQFIEVPVGRDGFVLNFAAAFVATAAVTFDPATFAAGVLITGIVAGILGRAVHSWFAALRLANCAWRPSAVTGACALLLAPHMPLAALVAVLYAVVLTEEMLFALGCPVIDEADLRARDIVGEGIRVNALDMCISMPLAVLMALAGTQSPWALLALIPPICAAAYMSNSHMQLGVAREELSEAQEAATTDALTGLANRRGTGEFIDGLAPDARCSVVALDIDHFKQINDVHGHAIGDEVLVQVSRIMREHAGAHHCGRLGGEEFVVVLQSDVRDAMLLANVLRRAIERHDFGLSVTASFGIAQGSAASFEAAVIRADQALYHSKHAGRNRVTVWNQPAPGENHLRAA